MRCLSFLLLLICGAATAQVPAAMNGTPRTGAAAAVTYATLRAANCSASEQNTVTSPTTHAGTFTCSTTDTYGDGDDGGITLASNNGNWWIRDFTHNAANPIEFDWYVNTYDDGDDVTAILDSLFEGPGAGTDLFVRMPTAAVTYRVNNLTWTGIDSLYILENGVDTLKLASTPTDANTMFDLGSYSVMLIGSTTDGAYTDYNLWFHGDTEGETGAGVKSRTGLFETAGTDATLRMTWRANIAWSRASGFVHLGSDIAGGIDSTFIEGQFIQSGVRVAYAWDYLWVDLYITDPKGRRPGWTGTGSNCNYSTYGSEKNYALEAINGNAGSRMEGTTRGKYGVAGAFFSGIEYVGSSDTRFTIESDSMMFTDTDQVISHNCGGASFPAWKDDAFRFPGYGKKFIHSKLKNTWSYLGYPAIQDQFDCGLTTDTETSGMDHTVESENLVFEGASNWNEGVFQRANSDCTAGVDYIRDVNISAAAGEPGTNFGLEIADSDTVTGGTWRHIRFVHSKDVATYPYVQNSYVYGATVDVDVTIDAITTSADIDSLTMPSTASIVVESGATNVGCNGDEDLTAGRTYDLSVLADRNDLCNDTTCPGDANGWVICDD